MIITKIIGGLGNQMFQYAAGRALSIKRGALLRLDISGFKNYKLHQGFEFQRLFNQNFEIASKQEMFEMLGWQSSSLARRVLARRQLSAFRNKRFIAEPHFSYWAEINNVEKNCYLSGYWQSEKYFSDITSIIRSDFAFQPPLIGANLDLSQSIGRVNAVSLHVRRGDYVANPRTTATHGLCTIDYYQSAIEYITQHVSNPHFFVFSDDIEWVEKNIKIDCPHQFVNFNRGFDSYNDMRLMSLCSHHVIANSSFSWWGAWLNPSSKKIVIAPKKWFAIQADTRDIYPSGWITL